MLVLSRHIGECLYLYIGDEMIAKVMVTGIKPNQVQIGIEAPQDVRISRFEDGAHGSPEAS